MCLCHVGLNPVCVWKDEVCTEIDHGGLTGFERTLRPLCKQEQTVSIHIYSYSVMEVCPSRLHFSKFVGKGGRGIHIR